MNRLFKNVGGAHPGRSIFNLSYSKKFSCDMGKLIPIMCDEVIPGDIFTIGNQFILRMTPLVAPILHQIDVFVHYFFVPYRLLWIDDGTFSTGWENFITGGPTGNLTPSIPKQFDTNPYTFAIGSLGDFFGMPTGVAIPVADAPIAFPWRAYWFIWNEYYRDETLQAQINIHADVSDTVMVRNWEKDYFTSALTFQQRGTSPAIPFTGTSQALWDTADVIHNAGNTNWQASSVAGVAHLYVNDANGRTNAWDFMNANTVDLSALTPLNIKDLRLAFQIQRWLERNARAGNRYTEFLRSHFVVSPRDDRLDRPEYIGGSKSPIIISEVLQTGKTDVSGTPQGNMAGHGISTSQEYISKYRVQEFGLIMGIMSIMPKPDYMQGMPRQWSKSTKFDFYFPEFAHLSEQAIWNKEIYATNNTVGNNTLFGYCGAYDELRTKQNMICGDFRDYYDYWHMGRVFGSTPGLNSTFIECVPRKDVFAVQNQDCCLVEFGNLITALRPMPIIAEPGLIDHG